MKTWQLVLSLLSVCWTYVYGLCIPQPPHCASETNFSVVLPCHMSNARPNLNCSFNLEKPSVMPPATLSPCDISSPAKPSDMKVSLYYWSSNVGCWPVLNISWRLPSDASAMYFTGFLLNVTGKFYYDAVSTNRIRNFSLTITAPLNTRNPELIDGPHCMRQSFPEIFVERGMRPTEGLNATENIFVKIVLRSYLRAEAVIFVQFTTDKPLTVFIYDCLPLTPGNQYRIALQSLPASSSRENSNVTMIYVPELPSSVATGSSDNCSQQTWSAEATVAPSTSRSSIIVAFPAAPTCYGFTKYNISLIDYDDDWKLMVLYRNTVIPSDGRVYHEFTNVCAITYKVFIKPIMSDSCECRKTDNDGNAGCDFCVVTVIGPIDMTTSHCPTPKPTDNGPDCPSEVGPIMSASIRPSSDQSVGAAVGVVIGALLIAIAIFVIIKIKYRISPSAPAVLLVYSHEHSGWHADVVYKFADFLEHVCGVKVVYIRNKSKCDLNPVDWVKKELSRVKDVVVCHSFDSNYYATGAFNSQLNTLEAFLSVWLNMQQNGSKIRYRVHHVFFDYCMSRSDAAVVVSRIGGSGTWFMPDHLEDFVRKIYDSSRARKSATNALEVSNVTETLEGRHLREAIRAASDAVEADNSVLLDSISVDGTKTTDISSTVVDVLMQMPNKPPLRLICPFDDNTSLQTDWMESQEIGFNRDYDKDLH